MKKIPRTFIEFLNLIVENGDATALCDAKTGKVYSYEKLVQASHDLALRLPIGTGDRVLMYKLGQIDWVILFFAIQVRGGVAVPVDERTSDDFLEKVIAQVEPVFMVTSELESPNVYGDIIHVKTISDLNKLSKHGHDEIIADSNLPCEIIYTSGTWSDPKGVVLSQRNILSNVDQIVSAYPHKENAVVLGILPLTHAYQQTLGLLTPLTLGSKIVFLKVTNSIELLEVIKKHRVTLIPLVPRVLELLYSAITRKIKQPRLRALFVSTVRLARFLPRRIRRLIFFFIHKQIGKDLHILVSGGSPLRSELDQFFEGLGYRVPVGYGLSEHAPIVAAHFGQRRRVGEIGKPLPNTEVTFTSENEMVVKGESVFLGYWPDVSGQDEIMTGDIGEQMVDGNLVIKGRNKNLIIFDNGEKCFCEDLETLVSAMPEVDSCCVIEKLSENVVTAQCVFTTSKDISLEEKKVIEYVHARTPLGIGLKKATLVTVADFPMTHTLKPNRAKISLMLDLDQSDSKTNSSS
jgi:long-chain acyl-CoA synthetase